MDAAFDAGVPPDECGFVDNLQLVSICKDRDVLGRRDRYDREAGALRFPAFGAPAGMIMEHLSFHRDFHRAIWAVADESAAGEVGTSTLHAIVQRWMDPYGRHEASSLIGFPSAPQVYLWNGRLRTRTSSASRSGHATLDVQDFRAR